MNVFMMPTKNFNAFVIGHISENGAYQVLFAGTLTDTPCFSWLNEETL